MSWKALAASRILWVSSLPVLQWFSLSVFLMCSSGECLNPLSSVPARTSSCPSEQGPALPNGLHCAEDPIQKQANGTGEGKAGSLKCVMIPINECLPRVLEYRDSSHKPVRVVFGAVTSYFLLKGNNLTFSHLLLLAVSASLIIAI